MNHLYFAVVPPGALLVTTSFVWWAHKQKPQPLSGKTRELINIIENTTETPPRIERHEHEIMSFADIWSLYLNSRSLVAEAHQSLLASSDEELRHWLEEAEDRHREVRRMLILNIPERLIGSVFKKRLGHYAIAALWAYVEEVTIVTEMRAWQVCANEADGELR